LPPALTVMEPPAGIPRMDSGVLMLSKAVPVPVAGDAEEPDELEEDDEEVVEFDDDEFVSPDKMLCIAADSWEFTRFKAVWLAILARPLPRLVCAVAIALITEVVAAVSLSLDCASLQ